jgi:hypothetical protein
MNRLNAGLICLLILLCGNAYAQFAIYTIDNQYKAVFPGSPQFVGETGNGDQRYRSYNYTDQGNGIVYTATYQVGKTHFSKKDVPQAIRNYVNAYAQVGNGIFTSYRNQLIDGNDSAVFSIKYELNGVPIRKYSVVAYKNGQFFQWAVADFPSQSALSAEQIFNKYLANFSTK